MNRTPNVTGERIRLQYTPTMRWRSLGLGLVVMVMAMASMVSCSDRDETDIRADVTLLSNHEGAIAAT